MKTSRPRNQKEAELLQKLTTDLTDLVNQFKALSFLTDQDQSAIDSILADPIQTLPKCRKLFDRAQICTQDYIQSPVRTQDHTKQIWSARISLITYFKSTFETMQHDLQTLYKDSERSKNLFLVPGLKEGIRELDKTLRQHIDTLAVSAVSAETAKAAPQSNSLPIMNAQIPNEVECAHYVQALNKLKNPQLFFQDAFAELENRLDLLTGNKLPSKLRSRILGTKTQIQQEEDPTELAKHGVALLQSKYHRLRDEVNQLEQSAQKKHILSFLFHPFSSRKPAPTHSSKSSVFKHGKGGQN